MTNKSPWSHDTPEPAIALPDRSTRINITDLKERIAISPAYTPTERDFLLDCINECSSPKGGSLENHSRGREQSRR